MSFEEKFDATKDKLAGEAKKAEGEAKDEIKKRVV